VVVTHPKDALFGSLLSWFVPLGHNATAGNLRKGQNAQRFSEFLAEPKILKSKKVPKPRVGEGRLHTAISEVVRQNIPYGPLRRPRRAQMPTSRRGLWAIGTSESDGTVGGSLTIYLVTVKGTTAAAKLN
jgi:hypothetical protein